MDTEYRGDVIRAGGWAAYIGGNPVGYIPFLERYRQGTRTCSRVPKIASGSGLFSLAVLALYAAGQERWGLIFGVVVLVHYVLSYDRVLWLVGRKQ